MVAPETNNTFQLAGMRDPKLRVESRRALGYDWAGRSGEDGRVRP